jgi:hypothetical protein
MSGRNAQRKLGTARGSPRRSRTAKASRISRSAVKSRCACEWGGWGRISDDGPGQHNPDPSEDPWGCGECHFMAVHHRACGPGMNGDPALVAKCTKGGGKPAVATCMSGADLSEATAGKAPLESQPSSRIGENPPYGMRGGIEETSASFEARYAPRSYPTSCSSRNPLGAAMNHHPTPRGLSCSAFQDHIRSTTQSSARGNRWNRSRKRC